MSKRAIIYQNIITEIDRIYNIERIDYENKLILCVNEEESSALIRPIRPNINQIDVIYHKIKNPNTIYKNS
jgi:hypothetical protein